MLAGDAAAGRTRLNLTSWEQSSSCAGFVSMMRISRSSPRRRRRDAVSPRPCARRRRIFDAVASSRPTPPPRRRRDASQKQGRRSICAAQTTPSKYRRLSGSATVARRQRHQSAHLGIINMIPDAFGAPSKISPFFCPRLSDAIAYAPLDIFSKRSARDTCFSRQRFLRK